MSKILSIEPKILDNKLRLARSERYACQSVARKALPEERVSRCLRQVISGSVEVWKHLETKKAFFNGLVICGSVWVCPVCAAKISERRRQELKKAYDTHIAEGGKVALLTLTFSHFKKDRLKETLLKFGQASQKFWRGCSMDSIKDKLGLIGKIRTFEVTYGSNGFHPHTHTAIFYQNDIELKNIESEMFHLWHKACVKYGLSASVKHGLKLEDGEKADAYLAKHGTWGLDQELTKSHIKKAKKDSLSPFDFLRKFLEDEIGDWKYITLYQEYAEALKGKRQLLWSPGLKKRFLIEEKSDEEIATEKIDTADLLGLLNYDEWKIILRNNSRSEFLDLVEKMDFRSAKDLLIDFFRKKEEPLTKVLF